MLSNDNNQKQKKMKTLRFAGMALLAVVVCMALAACGDDDEPNGNGGGKEPTSVVNPANVFTGGLPKSAEGATLFYNDKGLLTKMSIENGKEVTFEYNNGTRLAAPQNAVRMTIVDSEYDERIVFDMEINAQGFVKHCTETEGDGDVETWGFEYTTDGHLNYMKRSEGGNEITTITYQEGDIVHVGIVSEGEAWEASRDVKYTSGDVASPMPNKGCVMLFDNTFGVDMDEMKYAYYAGLLGKATKNLPIELIDHGMTVTGYDEVSRFKWTLNQDELPTQLDITEQSGYTRKMIFQW